MRTLLEAEEQVMTQNQLVEAMSSDPNTVASLLKRMETNQWIERRRHATDRRARCIIVLPAGRRQYVSARREARHLQQRVLAVLPPEARRQFLASLESVAEACRQHADENSARPARKLLP